MKERRSHQRAKSNTSLNCSFESNTSINCPVESNTSSNCPDESNTFINCPKESDTSINCSKGSNNSKNCLEEGNTSLKCPKLIEKQKWNKKTKEKYRSNRNMQIKSEKIKWQNDVKFKHYTIISETAQGWQKWNEKSRCSGYFSPRRYKIWMK